jgi:hypothetical protein
MKAFTLIATLLLATTAHAITTLTTGMGFGLNALDCEVLNATSKPIEVDSVTLLDRNGNPISTSSNCTFPGMISPGLACYVKDSVGGHYGRCVILSHGTSKSIRGTLLLFGDGLGANETILEAR